VRIVFLALLLLAAGSTRAMAAEDYALEILPDEVVSYRVELPVVHPGTLVVDADWSGSRVLSFRLERPGRPPIRKTGPPPLRLEIDVEPEEAGRFRTWTLWIRGLPSRLGAKGTLRVELPFPADPGAEPLQPVLVPTTGEIAPWRQPAVATPGLSSKWRRFHESTERFRRLVIDESGEPRPDSHLWQDEMLQFLVERRDGHGKKASRIAPSTRRWLTRLVEAIQEIDDLRSADDPVLGGPAPEKRSHYRAWIVLRSRQLDPLEIELDDLFHDVHDGYAPDLEGQAWITRLLSCLIACEQYFDERVLLGEAAASHANVAAAQWDPILAAARALSDLP